LNTCRQSASIPRKWIWMGFHSLSVSRFTAMKAQGWFFHWKHQWLRTIVVGFQLFSLFQLLPCQVFISCLVFADIYHSAGDAFHHHAQSSSWSNAAHGQGMPLLFAIFYLSNHALPSHRNSGTTTRDCQPLLERKSSSCVRCNFIGYRGFNHPWFLNNHGFNWGNMLLSSRIHSSIVASHENIQGKTHETATDRRLRHSYFWVFRNSHRFYRCIKTPWYHTRLFRQRKNRRLRFSDRSRASL